MRGNLLITGDIIPNVESCELDRNFKTGSQSSTNSNSEEEKMDLGSDPATHSSTTSSSRHRRLVIRHDDSNEDDEDFDDFSDIEPELVELNHRGRGLSDTGMKKQ